MSLEVKGIKRFENGININRRELKELGCILLNQRIGC
jgi:hypothetical protein